MTILTQRFEVAFGTSYAVADYKSTVWVQKLWNTKVVHPKIYKSKQMITVLQEHTEIFQKWTLN